MSAQYRPQHRTAMPIDADDTSTTRRDIDEPTYRYLETIWNRALRQAEQSAESPSDLQQSQRERNAANALTSAPAGDATRLSPSRRSGEGAVVASSPLPRAPPLVVAKQTPPPPPQSTPTVQPAPVPRRPLVPHRNTWMKVEAQPNLKRNEYTAHRGVAWVVQ